MTEDLIKQNAEEYADYFYPDRNSLFWSERYNSYIAGAHSCNEEIEELNKEIKELNRLLNYFTKED